MISSERDWPPGTVEILARRLDQSHTGQDLVQWAVGALAAGLDSAALRILAGLDLDSPATRADAEPLFERALSELGVCVPDRESLLRRHLRDIASEICAGSVGAEQGTERIHSEVLSPLNHPTDLMEWCYLSDGLHPDNFATLTGDVLASKIVATARRFLEAQR